MTALLDEIRRVRELAEKATPYSGAERELLYERAWLMDKYGAEIEAAVRDAERYGWLRDAHDCDWNNLLRDGGAQMDHNIDAAMKART